MMRTSIGVFNQSGNDADVAAFLAATGISDATITAALNTLVTGMKADGTWAKLNAIYPMVGGTANTCKYNLKNVAVGVLVDHGTLTYAANGVTGNGTSQYLDTTLTPAAVFPDANNGYICFCSRTNNNTTQVEMGCGDTPNITDLEVRYSGTFYAGVNCSGATETAASNSDSTGLYQISRINSATESRARKNSTGYVITSASVARSSRSIWICGANYTAPYYSSKQCSFAAIGNTGLSLTDMDNMYSRITTFNTALSR